MSYLVLARKYRPQTFREIVGQEHVTRTLANAFSQDRVHHAFLFCGPRGVGKTTAARVLGKALNCEKGPTAEPCGECAACQSITNGTSVDYFEMDGASNRGIDSIRDLTDAVRYQPAVLRKKVYVIDEVHMLTTEAFNALLKTLEEPPPHVTFVLATTEPHKVPNTILSRCQRYDFKLVPSSRLSQHVESIFSSESIAIEPGAVSLIVRESGGSVRDALSLCDQLISYVGDHGITEENVADVLGVADRSLTRSLVTALAAGDARTALESVGAAIERGVDEVQLARAIVRYLRDLAVLQVAGDSDKLVDVSPEERADLTAQAGSIEPAHIRQMFERMVKACEDLGESQMPRMVLDLALIDVAASEPVEPLGDLIDRLGDLERRTRGVSGGGGGGARPSRRPPRSAQSAPTTTVEARAEASAPAPPRAEAVAASVAEAVAEEPPPQSDDDAAAEIDADDSSPPATPDVRTDALRGWEKVISALEEARKMSLVSVYQQAKVLSWTDTDIEVGFPAGAFNADLATESATVDEMKAFLAEHRGRPVGFSVKLLSDADTEHTEARSILEADEENRQNERDRREHEARQHPLTNVVLETFGASIKEIKTDV